MNEWPPIPPPMGQWLSEYRRKALELDSGPNKVDEFLQELKSIKRLLEQIEEKLMMMANKKGEADGEEKGTIDDGEGQGRESFTSSLKGGGQSRREEVQQEEVELRGPTRAAANYGARRVPKKERRTNG